MPDWRTFVSSRLSLPPGAAHRHDEVVEEVAQELEEIYRSEVAGGATEAEAAAAALRELGDPRLLSEGCAVVAARSGDPARAVPDAPDEEATGGRWWRGVPQDLRHGLRMLRWRPGLVAAAILTMALGIGAATMVFSIVYGVLLRPLPYRDGLRLVRLELGDFGAHALSGPEFFDYRDRQQSLESFAIYMRDSGTLTGHGDPVRVSAVLATSDFFRVLGVPPMLGRTFASAEDRPGFGQVVVLRYGFWQDRLGGDPGIVGRTLTIDGLPHTVIGVMPPEFGFPSDRVDFWVPYGIDRAAPGPRTSHRFRSIGRLRPDRTLEQASAEIERIAAQLKAEYPAAYTSDFAWDVHLRSLHDATVGHVRPALWLLAGAVGFVLLVAGANVASLLLVRGASRQREIALRSALGARRGRIVRQLLTESLLLSSLGGLVGVGLAWLGVRGLVALEPASLPRLHEIGVDGTVLAVAVGLTMLVGLLFGLAPAWHAVPKDLARSLRETIGATESARRRRLGGGLVVAEVALSLMLLVGAGLLGLSLVRMLGVDLGFSPDNVLTFRLAPTSSSRASHEQRIQFVDQVVARVGALPGVSAVGVVTSLPLGDGFDNGFVMVEGKPVTDVGLGLPWGYVNAGQRMASAGYFGALRIGPVAGRLFQERDSASAPPVVIVDEEFAREAWSHQRPIGQRVAVVTDGGGPPVWRTVVGVVRHVREEGPARRTLPQAYFPVTQRPFGSLYVAVRTATPMEGVLRLVRREVGAVDPAVPLDDIQMLTARLGRTMATPRFFLQMMSAFSLLALVLCSVGLAGIVAEAVARRTREIGIRMTLGARRPQVLRLVVGYGLRVIVSGIVMGLVGARLLSRFMETILFGVSVTDLRTYATVTVLLCVVALAACWIPATRALRIDPIAALRAD